MMGWQDTAPAAALQLFERARWIEEHPGWTFEDYDNARAGDILFQREYERIVADMRRKVKNA